MRFHEMEEVEDTADNQSGETATEKRLRKGAVEVATDVIEEGGEPCQQERNGELQPFISETFVRNNGRGNIYIGRSLFFFCKYIAAYEDTDIHKRMQPS